MTDTHEYVEENGRRYHAYKDGKYVLPNDEIEQKRLDLQHSIFTRLAGNKLALAPIDGVQLNRALDLATGTGTWAIQFANQNPSVQVVGTDLSSIQPTTAPTNCSFIINDAEDHWSFDQAFDYIHARCVLTCFTDPKQVLQSAFDNLNPGGYLEMQDAVFPSEFDEVPPHDSPFALWCKLVVEGGQAGGRPWTNVQHYAQMMREVGFVDVEEREFLLYVGPWKEGLGADEKQTAILQVENFNQGIEALTYRSLARLGWSADDSKALAVKVKDEINSMRRRAFNRILFVIGKKPASNV